MANTFSQITIHAVFAVKHRESFIGRDWRDHLHQYIAGIITNKQGKSLAVGGWKDHVHILFGMPLTASIADFVGAIKANSSKWVNEQQLIKGKFQWQDMVHSRFPKVSEILLSIILSIRKHITKQKHFKKNI